MQAKDVMTRGVITIGPHASLAEAAELMCAMRISGLPVVEEGKLVGMLSEGDLIRRSELGTERKRPRWLEVLADPGRLADEYARSHGRKVDEVMTRDVISSPHDMPLDDLVTLMSKRHIKRVPITHGDALVGIVSRADLLRPLCTILQSNRVDMAPDDRAIRDAIIAELEAQNWAPNWGLNITVNAGTVDLSGTLTDERERNAIVVAVENIPGVASVRDHLVSIEPLTGYVVYSPDEEAAQAERPASEAAGAAPR